MPWCSMSTQPRSWSRSALRKVTGDADSRRASSFVVFVLGLAGLGGTELARSLGNAQGGLPFSVFFVADGSIYRKKLGQLTPQDLKDWVQSLA